MNQPIDSLFKSKLEHYATPASQDAWTRVESGLNKSSSQKIWIRIAASITLLAAASFLLVNYLIPDAQPLAQQVTEAKGSERQSDDISPQPVESVVPVMVEPKKGERLKKSVSIQTHAVEVTDQNPINPETEVTPMIEPAVEIIVKPATGLLIVYSAEEVNAKYLAKEIVTDATVEQKKSSRLQKLAGLAHNLSNEDILGDLRDRKNELFALNFLDDKKEKKN